jgi:hypothetical protein
MRARDLYEMIGDKTSGDDFIKVITPQGTDVEIVDIIRDPEKNISYLQTNG